jgi:16S rRNA (cytosine1402-N4)-methyltransferase
MHVNSEISALKRGLAAAWTVLKPHGRLAVVSFNSGEHRLVKEFAAGLARDYEVPGGVDVPALRRPRPPLARLLSRRAIRPGAAEVTANPRARSAQLRLLEKLPLAGTRP